MRSKHSKKYKTLKNKHGKKKSRVSKKNMKGGNTPITTVDELNKIYIHAENKYLKTLFDLYNNYLLVLKNALNTININTKLDNDKIDDIIMSFEIFRFKYKNIPYIIHKNDIDIMYNFFNDKPSPYKETLIKTLNYKDLPSKLITDIDNALKNKGYNTQGSTDNDDVDDVVIPKNNNSSRYTKALDRIRELQKTLDKITKQYNEVNKTIETNNFKNDSDKKKFKETIKLQYDQILLLTTKIETLKITIKTNSNTIGTLENEKKNLKALIIKNSTQMNELIQSNETEKSNLTLQIEKLQKELSEKNNLIQKLQSESKEKDNLIQSLQKELKEKDNLITDLRSKLHKSNEELINYKKNEHKRIGTLIENLNKSNGNSSYVIILNKYLSDVINENIDINLDEFEKNIKEREQKIKNEFQSKIDSLTKDIEIERDNVKTLIEKNADNKNKYDATILELNNTINTLKNELNTIKSTFESEKKVIETENAKLRISFENKLYRIKNEKEELDKMHNKYTLDLQIELNNVQNDYINKIQSKNETIIKMKENITLNINKNKDLITENDKLKTKNNRLIINNNSLITGLIKILNDSDIYIKNINENNKTHNKKIDNEINIMYEEYKKDIEEKAAEILSLTTNYETNIAAKDAEIFSLNETYKKNIAAKDAEIFSLNETYNTDITAKDAVINNQLLTIKGLEKKIEELNIINKEKIEELNRINKENIKRINEENEENIKRINEENEENIKRINEKNEEKINKNKEIYKINTESMQSLHDEEIKKFKREIEKLKLEYNSKIDELNVGIGNLDLKYNKLINGLIEKLDISIDEIKRLKDELNIEEIKNKNLEDIIDFEITYNKENIIIINTLLVQISISNNNNNTLRIKLFETSVSNVVLSNRLKLKESEIIANKNTIDTLINTNNELNKNVIELNNKNNVLEQRNADLISENKNLNQINQELISKNENNIITINDNLSKISGLEDKIIKKDEKLTQQEETLQQQEKELEKKDKDLEQKDRELININDNLKNITDQLNSQLENVNTLTKENLSVKRILDEQVNINSKQSREINWLTHNISVTKIMLESRIKTNTELTKDNKILVSENLSLKSIIEQYKSKIENENTNFITLITYKFEEEIRVLTIKASENESIQKENIHFLEEKIKYKTELHNQLHEMLAGAEEENYKLKNENKELNKEVAKGDTVGSKNAREAELLNEKLVVVKNEASALEKQNIRLKEELEKKQKEEDNRKTKEVVNTIFPSFMQNNINKGGNRKSKKRKMNKNKTKKNNKHQIKCKKISKKHNKINNHNTTTKLY